MGLRVRARSLICEAGGAYMALGRHSYRLRGRSGIADMDNLEGRGVMKSPFRRSVDDTKLVVLKEL